MSPQIALGRRRSIQPLSRPSMVGIWRLTGLVHQGHWCDLYAAQPADAEGSPRCDYVLKTVRVPVQEDPEAARQIRAEAAAGTSARHPHLIPILDGAVDAARPYLVMPRIEGGTLADALAEPARPLPVALWWVRQCAQAIAALGAAGWVHGDIKPENMMIDSRGHLTLIDLGFAHRLGADPGRAFQGTPDYAAPERLALSSPWHSAGDVYSLGVLLHRLVADRTDAPAEVPRLVEAMGSEDPTRRPAIADLVERLLQLEIKTLHLHIQPSAVFTRRVA